MRRWFRHHGLSVVIFAIFLATLCGQIVAGHSEYNSERAQRGQAPLDYPAYLHSPHFGEATAENWESEFFQMFVFVLATAFLHQKGSAESRDPDQKRAPHSRRSSRPAAPWPVRRGGWILRLYEHSLSLALFLVFSACFLWHTRSGLRLYNEDRLAHAEPPLVWSQYLASSRFWFESFQNWQSEFLSIAAMVLLTIWLREINSPESKKVETPHAKNED